MQCQLCKIKAATIHLTEIIDGKRTESHLCQSCAEKQGVTVKSQLSLNDLLSSLLAAGGQNTGNELQGKCDNCGMTAEQFGKQALLGCEKDYQVLGKALDEIIAKAQDGNSQHKGKTPCGIDKPADEQDNPKIKLEAELAEAVKKENYELAAELRDKLKEMQ